MYQSGGDSALLDWRIQFRVLAAADDIDEVAKMVPQIGTGRPGRLLAAEETGVLAVSPRSTRSGIPLIRRKSLRPYRVRFQ